MTEDVRHHPEAHPMRERAVRTMEQWAGLLGPPLAFLVDLELSYGSVHWMSLPRGHRLPLYLSSVIAFAVIVLCFALAYDAHHELHRVADEDEEREVERFAALGGMVISVIFASAVVAIAVPKFGARPW